MKEQKPKKWCKVCNEELPKTKFKLCNKQECYNAYYKKTENGPDDIVICLICDKILKGKLHSHFPTHNLNKKSYLELYPNAICESPNYLKILSDRMKGEKNVAFNHGGKFSPFSKKFVKYENLSVDETENKMNEMQIKRADSTDKNDNFANRLSYYLKQGLSEDEAKTALTNRQTTFSLEKCILKHGQERGHKVWQARQDKWMASLDLKSDEEKMRINRMKTSKDGCISMAERQIKKFFDDSNLEVITQYSIDAKIGYTYDFCVGKKIIEYNGTYWHCDPRVYTEDYFHFKIKKNSKEVWERDAKKQQYALDNGYELLVIWEDDYKKNKKETLQECLHFMKL